MPSAIGLEKPAITSISVPRGIIDTGVYIRGRIKPVNYSYVSVLFQINYSMDNQA